MPRGFGRSATRVTALLRGKRCSELALGSTFLARRGSRAYDGDKPLFRVAKELRAASTVACVAQNRRQPRSLQLRDGYEGLISAKR